MRKLLLIAAIAVIAMAGCKKDKDKTPVISITAQPTNVTVTAGSISGNLTVAATVTESATLSYQWFKNTAANNTGGTAVGGATGATFLIPTDLTAALSPYYYFCEVKATGGAKAVRSNAATVTVNPAAVQPGTPVITINTHPASVSFKEGNISATLEVEATVTESATLSYQWYENDANSNEGGDAIDGATSASFTIPTELTADTYYYFCEVSATGGAAKVRSNVATVTVNIAGAPVLTTAEVTDITEYSATIGGNITDEGTPPYTERGVCYATTANPTVANFKIAVAGSGTGAFTVNLNYLYPITTYYVRAYAISDLGTFYGNEVSFTTEPAAPALTTTVYNITATSATAGGSMNTLGAPYTERGVCYATTANPTIDDIKIVIAGTGTGSFSTNLTGLTDNTKYYVRAYAISSLGTFYGNEVSFTTSSAPPFAGSGTNADPYQIGTAEQLAQLAELVNAGNTAYNSKYYILTADINLDVTPYNTGAGWTPIGIYNNSTYTSIPFRGNFEGNNKKVSGLYIDDINLDNAGLFGIIDGGSVQNLGVVNVNIKGNNFVGGVAGWLNGSSSSAANCYSTGTISGTGIYVGGVAGRVYDGTLSYCYSTSTINCEGNTAGGVVGMVSYGNVTNCYSTGAVSSAGESVGGVAGAVGGSNITNCYSIGAVSGTDHVGGVAGAVSIYNSIISNITNCYSTGAVSGSGNRVGGLAGFVSGSNITNCAALNPSVQGTSSVGRVAGINYGTLTGNAALNSMTVNGSTVTSSDGTSIDGEDINATQTKERATYETKLGWDFTNVWKIEEGVGYPKLIWE